MNNTNIITLTDSYKFTHHRQYPTDTEYVYSYFESRGGAKFYNTVFFGLQYIIKKYLCGQVVTAEKIEAAKKLSAAHFMNPDIFNESMWRHIVEKHDGYLPVRIRAVPEGTPVGVSNVLLTIENTDPLCYPLTNHLETLLTHVWYSSTVASLSRHVKDVMQKYLLQTSDNPDAVNFQLHDFGMRGTSSMESAGIGGAGHLVNFLGTDTVNAMETVIRYYAADPSSVGFSVPATEHSVMTAEGPEGELSVIKRVLDAYPVGIVSIVSDSYDIERFVKQYIGKDLKEQILARNHETVPCKIVVRPDSLRFENDTPEAQMVWIAKELWTAFGGTINSKGYKVLDPHIGLIWGDGIDHRGIERVLDALATAGFSTENAVFGMGGGLLQKINRDTQRFAFKCSAQCRRGVWHDVFKDPLDASKASKRGRLKLVKRGAEFLTVPESDAGLTDVLETVFENGHLIREYTFDQVRANAII